MPPEKRHSLSTVAVCPTALHCTLFLLMSHHPRYSLQLLLPSRTTTTSSPLILCDREDYIRGQLPSLRDKTRLTLFGWQGKSPTVIRDTTGAFTVGRYEELSLPPEDEQKKRDNWCPTVEATGIFESRCAPFQMVPELLLPLFQNIPGSNKTRVSSLLYIWFLWGSWKFPFL